MDQRSPFARHQAAALSAVCATGAMTCDSLATYCRGAGEDLTPAALRSYLTGRRKGPLGLVRMVLLHADEADRPRVASALLDGAGLGLRVVADPVADRAGVDDALVLQVCRLSAEVGNVAREVQDALADDNRMDDREAERTLDAIDAAQQRLAELRAQVEAAAWPRRSRAVGGGR